MRRDYYVYFHVDPSTKDILYIGKGAKGRAWVFSGGRKQTNYGVRDRKHYLHLAKLIRHGYLPSEWVKIKYRGLTNKQALRIEYELIKKYDPPYNKACKTYTLLSRRQARRAKTLRNKGMSYSEIANKIESSTMTVYRLLKRNTKRFKTKNGIA